MDRNITRSLERVCLPTGRATNYLPASVTLSQTDKRKEVTVMCWEDESHDALYCGRRDGIVQKFSCQDRLFTAKCDCTGGNGQFVGLGKHNEVLITCTDRGSLCYWPLDTDKTERCVGDVSCMAKAQLQVATGGKENDLKVWDGNKLDQPIFQAKNVKNDKCPNKCSSTLQHQNIDSHVADECSLTTINCDFHHVGCAVTPEHLRENLLTHISLLATSHAKQQGKIASLKTKNKILKTEMKPLQQLLETAPLIVISRPLGPPVSNFQQRKRNNDERYSSPVYTHHQGYKICLCVYGNGLDRGKGTHVSVYVFWKV